MQIYKEMNIGTAKPTLEEMQGIKHYMIDTISPEQRYSVADYKKMLKSYKRDYRKRKSSNCSWWNRIICR